MNANLYAHFAFNTAANKPLVHLDSNKTITYEQIDKKTAQYCQLFATLGIKVGDRINQQTEKCVDALCVYLASLRFGTIYIPLNPAFTVDEVAYFITDAQPSLFIGTPSNKDALEKFITQQKLNIKLETLDENGDGTLQIKAARHTTQFTTAQCNPDDIACVLYTSGTTGKPKGAMLSHKNLLSNGSALNNCWALTTNDTLLHMLPIFHCHGLFFACNTILLCGANLIFLPKLDIDRAIKYLPHSTVLMGVPTYYTRLLSDSRFTQELTQNVRLFISGSAPLLEKTFFDFKQITSQKILERYGMTETGINTSNPLVGERLPSSVGLPLAGVDVRVVDDLDQPVKAGEAGHIQIKGDNVFSGYWNKPEQTAESFTKDGYFKTGDIGSYDSHGYLSIVGRSKDLIITGGLNVYPKEIELIIDKIPGVQESAVIGLNHVDLGEAVTAIIVAKEGAKLQSEVIISSLKLHLANYKIPKKVLFVDELPRNTMSKVQKNILRDNYKDLYQLSNR